MALPAPNGASAHKCSIEFLLMTTSAKQFTAVAFYRAEPIPFGPSFKSAAEAWLWLHSDACAPCPMHDRIDVYTNKQASELVSNFFHPTF